MVSFFCNTGRRIESVREKFKSSGQKSHQWVSCVQKVWPANHYDYVREWIWCRNESDVKSSLPKSYDQQHYSKMYY